MRFSVVIPAHNEARSIGQAVAFAGRQSIARRDYEIVVVDNGSSDETGAIALAWGADTVVREMRLGTNIARQAGVDASSGEIVAFLDADSVPPLDWLEGIERHLGAGGFAAVSGPYDYGFTGWRRLVLDAHARLVLRYLHQILPALFGRAAGVVVGGNFALRRATIERIGGLPPVPFFGDDAAIGIAVSRTVGAVAFVPGMRVQSSPRRFEQVGFWRLSATYAWHYLRVYFQAAPAPRAEPSVP